MLYQLDFGVFFFFGEHCGQAFASSLNDLVDYLVSKSEMELEEENI